MTDLAAQQAGLRVFTLSNGAAASTRKFLERAGVAELAVREAGVPADRVALVAVHSWDVHGARQVGLTTGWCPRLEGEQTPVFAPADITADTLDGVIAGLAALEPPNVGG